MSLRAHSPKTVLSCTCIWSNVSWEEKSDVTRSYQSLLELVWIWLIWICMTMVLVMPVLHLLLRQSKSTKLRPIWICLTMVLVIPVVRYYTSLAEAIKVNKTNLNFCVNRVVRSYFQTLVVLLSLSLFTLTTQVITSGTSSDLFMKVWVTAYKGDTYWAVNL